MTRADEVLRWLATNRREVRGVASLLLEEYEVQWPDAESMNVTPGYPPCKELRSSPSPYHELSVPKVKRKGEKRARQVRSEIH